MSAALRVAVLTVSDSGAAGQRVDRSGPVLQEVCAVHGWSIVATTLVPDDVDLIRETIRHWADASTADLILTTGGTGISARDVTPEATRAVLDRELPGMAELIRTRGLEQNQYSVLSRAVVGTRGQSLIVNLPGSPKGAQFSLEVIAHLVPHAVALLQGDTDHTPRTGER
jgi:molybdenum cofactor synthesis domain-containing protein